MMSHVTPSEDRSTRKPVSFVDESSHVSLMAVSEKVVATSPAGAFETGVASRRAQRLDLGGRRVAGGVERDDPVSIPDRVRRPQRQFNEIARPGPDGPEYVPGGGADLPLALDAVAADLAARTAFLARRRGSPRHDDRAGVRCVRGTDTRRAGAGARTFAGIVTDTTSDAAEWP